jgi:hypothetical protein
LLEVADLTPYPASPLSHPLQNLRLGCGHRGNDLNRRIGQYRYLHRTTIAPYEREINGLIAVL